ncbi:MAG: FAD-dependent oxidoreductase [Anaerolineales bacterium]
MSEKVDVIVVGAGLAGLGAAYHLAGAGLEVLVVERGDYPGSKNVTGGRLYLNPVRVHFPQLFGSDHLAEVPFERLVVKERLTTMADQSAATLEFESDRFRSADVHSVTILRGVFDRWLADIVAARGALVAPGYKVDDLIIEAGCVAGIVSAGDELRADVVVAADGALSFMAERAGLRARQAPHRFALGIKEVIELPPATIEARFGLASGEGAAQLFFGCFTQGMTGGGFIYTNRESLSLGIVVNMGALSAREPPVPAPVLFDAFKSRPEVARLVAGGETVEYAAHAVPEGGGRALPRLVRDGLVVVGDAAGLALNLGVTVRGMDFALASGALAAQAIIAAKSANDFTAGALARYEQLLRESFVWQGHQTFAHMPEFLENERLYGLYPRAATALLEELFWIGDQPKRRLWETVTGAVRRLPLRDVWRDFRKARRI